MSPCSHSFLAGLATAALLSLGSAGPSQAGTPGPAAEAPGVVELGENATDHMTVPVHVSGAGPFPFVLDTAATSSVISRELAAALQLKPAGRTRLVTLSGSSEAMRVHVPGLTFASGAAQDVRALVLAEAHLGGRGILGIDALRNRHVRLDFKGRTFEVSDAPRRWIRDDDPDVIVVSARRRLGQLILADSSIDGRKIDVIVDTGAQVSLGNEALRRLLLQDIGRYRTTPISLVSVTGGVLDVDYTRVDRLRIGPVALIGMPIAFSDAYPFRRLKLRKPALLLGMDALRMFERVTLDFANRKATFTLAETRPGAAPLQAPGSPR